MCFLVCHRVSLIVVFSAFVQVTKIVLTDTKVFTVTIKETI